MTEAMPFLRKCDITFLRPPPFSERVLFYLPGGLAGCIFLQFALSTANIRVYFRRAPAA